MIVQASALMGETDKRDYLIRGKCGGGFFDILEGDLVGHIFKGFEIHPAKPPGFIKCGQDNIL